MTLYTIYYVYCMLFCINVFYGKYFASADNADRGLNNSDILRKPNSIILLLIILQEKSAM